MTDNPQPTTTPESDLITSLRNEMQTQYNTLKETMDSALKERDETIAKLTQEKQALQNALVVSSISPKPVEEEVPKTKEQLYQEDIDRLAKKTLSYMQELC